MTMFLFSGSERNTTLTKIEGSLPTLQIENSAAHPLPAEHAMPSHCSHWICCLALVSRVRTARGDLPATRRTGGDRGLAGATTTALGAQ